MEIRNGLNAFVKIKEIEFFIRAMQVIAVESKTHEYDLQSQFLFKQGTDRNTAAAAYRDRVFAKVFEWLWQQLYRHQNLSGSYKVRRHGVLALLR
jgi:hypothetical protein